MFTGIVETVGTVAEIDREDEHVKLRLSTPDWLLSDVVLGDSISVNGACLTVVEKTATTAAFDIIYETMRKTSLGHLAVGDPVNLERALLASGRFDGHIVQGHVEATGSVASIRQIDNSFLFYIDVPRALMRYIVRKGSITVDGISLTVVDAEDRTFSVSIIPHTWEKTNLHIKRAGDPVNIETDIIAKYVERLNVTSPYGEPTLIASGRSLENAGRSEWQYDGTQNGFPQLDDLSVQATG